MKGLTKKLYGFFALLFATTCLASCGPRGGDDYDVDPVYDGEPVEITFVSTASETKLLPIIKAYVLGGEGIEEGTYFTSIFPNITVNFTHADGYDKLCENISIQLSTDAQPDVAYCYSDHVALYNKTKKVIPYDSFMESQDTTPLGTFDVDTGCYNEGIVGLTQEQVDDYIPGFYNEGRTIGGGDDTHMYNLPFLKSTEILYYNKTFFETNGLSVPTTWDEMEAVCAAIKRIDPTSTPLGIDSAANWFITMCEQGGYPYTVNDKAQEYFLFDNTDTRAFTKRFAQWYQKGYVTTQKIFGGYTSTLFKQTQNDDTRSYMCIGSSAGATNQCPNKGDDGKYPFEVGCAQIPQLDPTNAKVISQGPSLCIFKHNSADNQRRLAASWLLVKFFNTNVAFQTEFSIASGYVPCIKSVNDYSVYNRAMSRADGNGNLAASANKFCLSQSDYYFTSPAFVGSSVARNQAEDILSGIMASSVDESFNPIAESALDQLIDEKFKAAIAECKYQAGL